MERTYLPVLMLLGFVAVNAAVILLISHLTLRPRPTAVKQTAYESGIPVLGDARERFSVKFYMVAVLFILFDIEAVFLYPWAVAFRQLGLYGLIEMVLFIVILLAGYLYLLKKRALEWE
jgi:NADH-quinone oxidoreductase subunit A